MQGTHNSQNIFEKEWSRPATLPGSQNLLQNYSNQDSADTYDIVIDQQDVINSLEILTLLVNWFWHRC